MFHWSSPLYVTQYKATPGWLNLQNMFYVITYSQLIFSPILYLFPLQLFFFKASSLSMPTVSSANDYAHSTPFLNLANSTASAAAECQWILSNQASRDPTNRKRKLSLVCSCVYVCQCMEKSWRK